MNNPSVVQAYDDKDAPARNAELIPTNNAKFESILQRVNEPSYKKMIMNTYNISNDEYNGVIKTMIGMYGQESKFDTDYSAKFPPEPKWATYLNPWWKDQSVGPFQLKVNAMEEETRDMLPREGSEAIATLNDPATAADYAVRFLAENVKQLRRRAKAGKTKNLTKENYMEYLPYVVSQQGWLARSDKQSKRKKGTILGEGTNLYKDAINYYNDQLGLQLVSGSVPNFVPEIV